MTQRLVILLVLACAVAPVRAEDRAAAERSFRTAERAYKAQNFEAAAIHYEAAYRELPLPEIAFSAAQAYRKQYRVEPKLQYVQRAIALYESYLDKVKTGGRVSDAADNLGEMRTELLRIQPPGAPVVAPAPVAPKVRTQLAISPQLASERQGQVREVSDVLDDSEVVYVVTIDGKPVEAFVPIEVTPGPHKIRVEAVGYEPVEIEERAIESVSTVAEVKLSPRPGRVTVNTERGARILVDGLSVGATPRRAFELPAGRHLITISREGRHSIAREIMVTRGGVHELSEPLVTTGQRRAVLWVSLGAGGLGVLTVATGIYAASEHSRAQEMRDQIDMGDGAPSLLRSYNKAIDRADQLSTATWLTGGAAVAVGLTALGLYMFDSPGPAEMRITPTAGATGGGLSLSGRF